MSLISGKPTDDPPLWSPILATLHPSTNALAMSADSKVFATSGDAASIPTPLGSQTSTANNLKQRSILSAHSPLSLPSQLRRVS